MSVTTMHSMQTVMKNLMDSIAKKSENAKCEHCGTPWRVFSSEKRITGPFSWRGVVLEDGSTALAIPEYALLKAITSITRLKDDVQIEEFQLDGSSIWFGFDAMLPGDRLEIHVEINAPTMAYPLPQDRCCYKHAAEVAKRLEKFFYSLPLAARETEENKDVNARAIGLKVWAKAERKRIEELNFEPERASA